MSLQPSDPNAVVADLLVLATWRVAPPVHFWELQWHIKEVVLRAKDSHEMWGSLKPMQRRVFLMFIACAVEGGDL